MEFQLASKLMIEPKANQVVIIDEFDFVMLDMLVKIINNKKSYKIIGLTATAKNEMIESEQEYI